jgi:MFS superfamily sulfate permease-like transporter
MAPNPRVSHARNAYHFRHGLLAEVSGALGDLGTLLPLLLALTLTSSVSFAASLVFGGLANIVTGVVFGVPLPVQPMKAIAAVAVSQSFSRTETAAAGLFVSGLVFVAAATGALRWLTSIVPVPVVKGIQVGAGLSLAISAGIALQPLHWLHPWADNLAWAVSAFVVLCITARLPRFPYALVIFLVGLVSAALLASTRPGASLPDPDMQLWHPHFALPSPGDVRKGVLSAGIGQLPLTTLNSIIAVEHLARDLLPDHPSPGITSLGVSVGVANLIGCWFGSMPICHGSGGLAAQWRFGARSGASIIILGTFKLALGLVFGNSLVDLLACFPRALLSLMVFAAGLELAKVGQSLNYGARDLREAAETEDLGDQGARESLIQGRVRRVRNRDLQDEERSERWIVMMTTVGALLAFKNDGVGFVAGMLAHWSFQLPRWWSTRRP